MSQLFYSFLPALLFLHMQHPTAGTIPACTAVAHHDSIKVIMDSNDIRIFLEAKKTILYTVSNMVYATDKQDKNKQYIDGYEILSSSKVGYKKSLSLKTCLLTSSNYSFDVSRCSFFPKYCLSFSSRAGRLNFFLPGDASCNVITILKINSIGNKEMEFSFSKDILDKIKKSSDTVK